jgi:hypothetical protein
VHTRIAQGRSVCTSAVDARVRELTQPAFKELLAKRIDGAELERRVDVARKQAETEHGPLGKLNRAAAAWSAAVEARVAAEATEDAAEAALEEALRELEAGGGSGGASSGGAGPSGVKKE